MRIKCMLGWLNVCCGGLHAACGLVHFPCFSVTQNTFSISPAQTRGSSWAVQFTQQAAGSR